MVKFSSPILIPTIIVQTSVQNFPMENISKIVQVEPLWLYLYLSFVTLIFLYIKTRNQKLSYLIKQGVQIFKS